MPKTDKTFRQLSEFKQFCRLHSMVALILEFQVEKLQKLSNKKIQVTIDLYIHHSSVRICLELQCCKGQTSVITNSLDFSPSELPVSTRLRVCSRNQHVTRNEYYRPVFLVIQSLNDRTRFCARQLNCFVLEHMLWDQNKAFETPHTRPSTRL